MSQENVELVRRAFAAYAHGGAEALVQYATPDCAFYPDPSWIEEGVYRGQRRSGKRLVQAYRSVSGRRMSSRTSAME
jgi:ketosteroid isomerase-like protein